MNEVTKRGFPLNFDQPQSRAVTFNLTVTPEGAVIMVRDGNGNSKATMVPALPETSPLAKPVEYVTECVKAFINDHGEAVKNYLGDALQSYVGGAAMKRFGQALPDVQQHARKVAQDNAVSRAGLIAVDPATPANSHLRARALDLWAAADQSGRESMALNKNAPYETLAALIETNALSGVSDRARNAAEQLYMVQRLIAKTGSSASHQVQPSYESPVAVGVDGQAARDAAMVKIRALDTRSAEVASVGDMLRGLCDVLSFAIGTTPQATYKTLIANTAA